MYSEPFSERVGPSADPTAPSGRSYNPRQMTSDPIDLAPAVPSAPPPPPPPRTLLRLRSLCRVQLGTWQCFGSWFNRPAHGGAGGGKSRGDAKLCPSGRRFLSHKYTFLALRPKVQGARSWLAIIRKGSLKTDQLAYLVRSKPFSPPSYCPNLRCWVSSAADCTYNVFDNTSDDSDDCHIYEYLRHR